MSWEDADGLERGGACNGCGAEVEEEHHAFCSACYAEAQGWRRPDRAALEWQHEDRQQVTIAEIVARLAELERVVRRLERERAA